jgi:hypothetical protein
MIEDNKGKPDKEKHYISFKIKGKPDTFEGIPFDVKGVKDQTTVSFIRVGTKNVKFVKVSDIIFESKDNKRAKFINENLFESHESLDDYIEMVIHELCSMDPDVCDSEMREIVANYVSEDGTSIEDYWKLGLSAKETAEDLASEIL